MDLSIASLKTAQSGHRYDYALFPGLGHNNMDRTFSVATDWIKRAKQLSGSVEHVARSEPCADCRAQSG